MQEKQLSLETVFSEIALFCKGRNKGYINLRDWVRVFQGDCTSLVGAKVLKMLHLHEEEFQVFAGHVLLETEKV